MPEYFLATSDPKCDVDMYFTHKKEFGFGLRLTLIESAIHFTLILIKYLIVEGRRGGGVLRPEPILKCAQMSSYPDSITGSKCTLHFVPKKFAS